MKHAKISELKAHLSEYLAKVRRGGTVVVLDRTIPIARIVPYEERSEGFHVEKAIAPPSAVLKVRPVHLRKSVNLVSLLREDRDQR
jgi:prevent-host-death family protein